MAVLKNRKKKKPASRPKKPAQVVQLHPQTPVADPVPESQQPAAPEQQPAADSVADPAAPGRDELEALARGDQPAQPAAGPAPGAADPVTGIAPVIVGPEHIAIAGVLATGAAKAVEGFLPVRYGPQTIDAVANAAAPVVAKYYGHLPLWYLRFKEEIHLGVVVGKVAIDTFREVRRVNEIEAQIEEIASKYRADGANRKVARERAMQELGYSEGAQPAAKAA